MSLMKTSSSLNAERTSIHDMLKDTPAHDTNKIPGSAAATTATNSNCIYSRSVPTNLSTSSPAILTPSPPNQQEDSTVLKTSSRIENLKNWSISTYKCTKQIMFEKLGKSSRTVDTGMYSI